METSETQHAIIQTRYGDAHEALTFSSSHTVSAPLPGQVQVRVHAASLNPIDWQMIEGNRRLMARRTFPFVPLFDLAGVVTAVGEGVTGFRVGDAVHADNEKDGGGASELVNVGEDLLHLMPPSLSFAEAAAVPLAAQTALLALESGGVGAASRVCIIGASGGVGTFAVQIAKALGASRVVGVCSARNRDFVESLGADQTVDYGAGGFARVLGRHSMDVVVDCVGGREQWIEARRVLAPKGKFVTISRDEDGAMTPWSMLVAAMTLGPRMLRSHDREKTAYVPVFLKASQSLLGRVDKLIAEGKLKAHISGTFPFSLAGVTAAIEESKNGRVVGKLVIEIVEHQRERPARRHLREGGVQ